MLKTAASFISIIFTFIAFYPYVKSIRQGKTKPHFFSWIIWTLTTGIVFFAQLADEGGVGAWPTAVSALITFYVAYLAFFQKSDYRISFTDWGYFIAALLAIPFWYLTDNPLIAVLLLTSVDILGSFPTFRKVYFFPWEEQILFYFLMSIRNLVSIYALENYSLTTILFPAAVTVLCFFLIGEIQWRRKVLK